MIKTKIHSDLTLPLHCYESKTGKIGFYEYRIDSSRDAEEINTASFIRLKRFASRSTLGSVNEAGSVASACVNPRKEKPVAIED